MAPLPGPRPDAAPASLLRIFVYGTLMRGGRFHDEFCRDALSIEEAQVLGQLYTTGPYPVLSVPDSLILAVGTADPLADLATQDRSAAFADAADLLTPAQLLRTTSRTSEGGPHADWELIPGELITLGDPTARLGALDHLEGFNPGAKSLYRRVLLPVRVIERGEVEVGWGWSAIASCSTVGASS